MITNNGEDNSLRIYPSEARLFGVSGNEYYAYKVQIGSSVGTNWGNSSSCAQLKLVSGIPVKAIVQFKGNIIQESMIKLLEVNLRYGNFQFRDIPVHSKYPQKPSDADEKQNKSLKMVTKRGKFVIELTSCNVLGQDLVFSFMITNKGKDNKFTINPSKTRILDASGNEFYAYKVQIGNSVGARVGTRAIFSYSARSNLVSGIPVKASVRFKGNAAKVRKIKLLEVSTINGRVKFRNIPVSI
jgi:hypothetical protein